MRAVIACGLCILLVPIFREARGVYEQIVNTARQVWND